MPQKCERSRMAAASTGFAYGLGSLLTNRTEPELLSSALHRGGVLATSSSPLSAAAISLDNPQRPQHSHLQHLCQGDSALVADVVGIELQRVYPAVTCNTNSKRSVTGSPVRDAAGHIKSPGAWRAAGPCSQPHLQASGCSCICFLSGVQLPEASFDCWHSDHVPQAAGCLMQNVT